jgi:uncharacterized protein YecE (DUF72 family)
MPLKSYIGCSGWYYLHWKERFYPGDLPTSRWFSHYLSCFNAVEANSSFYRIPKPQNVKTWARNVKSLPSEQFKYSVKMSKPITHVAKLELPSCENDLISFFSAIAFLKDYLGTVLLQLPPSFKQSSDNMDRLGGIRTWIDSANGQGTLGEFDFSSIPMVVEFRHASWFNEGIIAAIEDLGFVVAVVDAPARAKLPMVYTGRETMYLRLHGHDPTKWYRYDYTDAELESMHGAILDHAQQAGTTQVFVFFDNDFEGNAPRNAIALANLFQS